MTRLKVILWMLFILIAACYCLLLVVEQPAILFHTVITPLSVAWVLILVWYLIELFINHIRKNKTN
jgi:hypothetical protein